MLRIVDRSLDISLMIGGVLHTQYFAYTLGLILDFSVGIIKSQSLGKVDFVINSSDDVNLIVARQGSVRWLFPLEPFEERGNEACQCYATSQCDSPPLHLLPVILRL